MIGGVLSQHAWLWMLAWQSTLCLAAGLGGSLVLRRRPARAHQVLVIGLVAAVMIPALSGLVRQRGWGLLMERPAAANGPQAEPAAAPDAGDSFESPQPTDPEFTPTASSREPDSSPARQPRAFHPGPWFLSAWILAASVLLIRLVARFTMSLHLVRGSRPARLAAIADVIETAKSRLNIDRAIAVHRSERIRSPVIWCWTSKPILLIPMDANEDGDYLDWTGIVCHELAHWKRRDHICGLVAELMLCALPWQALLWWAHRRLVRLSEQACDDWVVACGQSGVDYAETLLDLTPQGRIAFVPAVVSSRKPLAERIHRLLQDGCGNPRPGLRWSVAAVVLATCVTLGIAFAQTRSVQPSSKADPSAASRKKLNEILDAVLLHDKAVMPIALHADIELYGYEAAEWKHGETYSFEQRLDGRRLDSVFTRYRIENGTPRHVQSARRIFTGEQYLYRQEEIAPTGNRLSASLYPPEEARDVMAYYYLWGGVLCGYLDGDSKPVAAILKDSPATVLHDEMEDVDGAACHVIEGSTDYGTYQLWVDPQHDYRIRKAIVHKGPGDWYYRRPIPKDAPIDKWNTARVRNEISGVTLEEIGGHFIPVAETQITTRVRTDGSEYSSREVVKRSAIDVRPDFDRLGAFVMDGIPDGTRFAMFDPNNTNYGYEWRNGKAVPIAPDGPTILGRVRFTGYDDPQMALTERREFRATFQRAATAGGGRDERQSVRVGLGKDGSFRIENVPPGRYSLQLALTESSLAEIESGNLVTRTIAVARADREISVPDAGTQSQQKTLDLGDIEMVIEGDQAVSRSRQTRSLRFPQDRSLGTLYMRDDRQKDWYEGWEKTGEAKGNIFVGAGKQVKLEVNEETAADLSSLAGLKPDDVQMFCVGWKPVTVGSLAPLAKLTGLRAINLQTARFDPEEFRYLTGLVHLEVLRLGDQKLTDSSMQYVGKLTSLQSLNLWGTGVSDEGLRHLQELTALTFLALNSCAITDEGLLYLHGMTALEGLQLSQTKISDDGLARLQHLTRLKHIKIDGNKITDAGMKRLEKLSQLENVWIEMNPITDVGFASLSKMTNLKELYANETRLTDAGLTHLQGLTHLYHIIVGGIGDEGIRHLSGLPALGHVQILDAKVTKASVPYFQAMPSLEKLLLSGDMVDDDLLDALKAALPRCQVQDPQRSREYPMPAWRQKFEAVYRLADGEVLKRIAPPFIPERMDYYRADHESQAESIPDGPDSMTFHWDRKLKHWGMSFGHRVGTLNHALRDVLGLRSYEYDGPKEMLDIDLPGDWIVRDTASQEAKLRALEQLMAKELGWKIHFDRHTVGRPVIVATGQFQFRPLPEMQAAKDVQLHVDGLDVSGGGTAHSVADLLETIGDRANVRIIDKTEPSTETQIPYNLHRSSRPLREIENGPEKDRMLRVLLDNLTKQTQLHFEVRTEPVEIWQVRAEN